MFEQDRCLGCGKEPERDKDDLTGGVGVQVSRHIGLDFTISSEAVKTLPDIPRKGWLCWDCWIGGMVWAARERFEAMVKEVHAAGMRGMGLDSLRE